MTQPDRKRNEGAGPLAEHPDPFDLGRWAASPEMLAIVVFIFALAVTLFLGNSAKAYSEQGLKAEFNFQVRQTTKRIEERMATYEQVQRGAQAFLMASDSVNREEFRLYVSSLRLEEKYPGIQGLAISQIVPKDMKEQHIATVRREGFPNYTIFPTSERDTISTITHIEPFSGLNLRAHGYDMLTDSVRREAMERARDTGQAAASGKVKLIQENGERDQSGLVMYFPVYRRGATVTTVEERRKNIVAWIGAPFRMNDLMAGLGGERSSDIIMAIYDGHEASNQALLFHSIETPSQSLNHASLLQAQEQITVGGRPWTLLIRSSPVFETRLQSSEPTIIVLGGVIASAILSILFWSLASGRKRALALANSMTNHLRESEFRWKYALEGAGDGVWDLDTATGKIMFSKRWKEMLGYADSDLKGEQSEWVRLIHPEDLSATMRIADEFLSGVRPTYSNEFRMQCKDGSWKWILARGTAVSRTNDGAILRAIGTHTDITEHKQNEEALQESNNRLAMEQHRMRVILENSHDAFVALDSDGHITDWNVKAEQTFGWTSEEALGKDFADLIIPREHREAHRREMMQFSETDNKNLTSNVIEAAALHKDGHVVPVELALAGVPQLEGFAVSAFIRDISERKEAERNQAERAKALEEARVALQHSQKLEAVGKLTGGVAHDFNNVLQTIGGNVELLRFMLAGQHAIEKRLDGVMSAVDRGAKLSSQLLAFARRQPLQPVVINPSRIVVEMEDLLQRALGEAIALQTSFPENLWNVAVDRGQFENVVLNLTINARDAMPDGGILSIVLKNETVSSRSMHLGKHVPDGEYVFVLVADNGIGMSNEVLDQAFEPFFTTKPLGVGTGLGLSMAYGFVKQSGGYIQIDSAPGEGTAISIYLPKVPEAEETVPSEEGEAPVGGSETILVVEDDAEVRATVVGLLSDLGYEVIEAHDGESGLDRLRSGKHVDLLFTDVVMPGPISSPILAQEGKVLIPDLAVLFTSGYTRNALVSGGQLEKGVQLLSKPYNREQLAKRIRQVLASSTVKKDFQRLA